MPIMYDDYKKKYGSSINKYQMDAYNKEKLNYQNNSVSSLKKKYKANVSTENKLNNQFKNNLINSGVNITGSTSSNYNPNLFTIANSNREKITTGGIQQVTVNDLVNQTKNSQENINKYNKVINSNDTFKKLEEARYNTEKSKYDYNVAKVNSEKSTTGSKIFMPFISGALGNNGFKLTNSRYVKDKNGNYVNFSSYNELKNQKLADDSGTLGKLYNGAMTSIGQMMPSALLGAVTGGVATAAGGTLKAINTAKRIGSLGTLFVNVVNTSNNQKLLEGYTKEQASKYSLMSGAIETGTELLSGGMGKVFGTGALDKYFTEKVTEGIQNKVLKTLVASGIDDVGEGLEEVIGDLLYPVADKLALGSKESYKKLLKDQNMTEDFFSALISSAIMSAPSNVISFTKNKDTQESSIPINSTNNNINSVEDLINNNSDTTETNIPTTTTEIDNNYRKTQIEKLTTQESNIQTLLDNSTSETEKASYQNQIKLLQNQINDLQDSINNSKANLTSYSNNFTSTDIANLNDLITSENAFGLDENETKKYNELSAKLIKSTTLNNNIKLDGIKQTIPAIKNNVKLSVLNDLKNNNQDININDIQLIRNSQNGQITALIDYNGKADENTISNLIKPVKIDSLNIDIKPLNIDSNNNITSYLLDNVANNTAYSNQNQINIPEVKQSINAPVKETFESTAKENNINLNNDVIKQLKQIMQFRNINILFDNTIDGNGLWNIENNVRTIRLNPNTDAKVEFVMIHELTHDLEGTQEYKELTDILDNYNKGQSNFKSAQADLLNIYQSYAQNHPEFNMNVDIKSETYADMTGTLLGNKDFLNELTTHKTLIRKIVDWINKQIQLFNAKTTQEKENIKFLYDLKSKFIEAYNSDYIETNSNIKNSIKNIENNSNIRYNKNDLDLNDTNNRNGLEYGRKELDNSSFKLEQYNIIQKTNPAPDEGYVWIRSPKDIKTFNEVIDDEESFVWGDYSREDALKDLKRNEVTIYSSYPIENGTFVSTSYNQARDYSGGKKVYSKTIPLNEVAWINGDEGQYAKVSQNIKSSQSSNGKWNDYLNKLDKVNSNQTKTNWEDVKIPSKYDNIPKAKTQSTKNTLTTDELKEIIAPSIKQAKEKIKPMTNNEINSQVNNITNKLEELAGFNNDDAKKEFKDKIKLAVTNGESITQEDIKNLVFANSGTIKNTIVNNYIKEVKKTIKNTPIKVDSTIKGDITDYNDWKKSNFGRIRFSNDAEGVDQVYADLSDRFPNLFPIEISNPTDELLRIEEIAKSDSFIEDKIDIDNKTLEEYSNNVYKNVNQLIKDLYKSASSKSNVNLPNIPSKNYTIGDGKSKFYKNVTETSKMITPENREIMKTIPELQYYEKVSNQESLEAANNRLKGNPEAEITNWINKDSKDSTSVDVAEGWILLKRYQDNGNYQMMVEVAKKMRSMGSTAGQTIQAYNIMERLTPLGMVKYAQSELSEAYDTMSKGKTKEWKDNHRALFDLTPEETQFILQNMEDIQNMEDGYDKKVKLAEIQKVMTDKLPPEKGAGIKAWMRISMLFNPKTQVRNIVGNTLIAPINSFGDIFSSYADKLISKKTGIRTTGNTNINSYLTGFKKGAYESYNDFKKGINTQNIQGNRFEIGEGKSFNDKTIIGKALNHVDNLLSFMLSGGDRTFYEGSFTNSINNQLVLNNTTEVTQDMIDIATQEALQRTWNDNNNYTKFVLDARRGLNKLTPNLKYGLGDVLIPFAKTPANLTKAIVDYSPAGLVKTINEGISLKRSLTNGEYTSQMQHQFVQDLGKAVAGTALYIIGYALAKAKITSGDSDDDKDVASYLKNTLGISSYSIKIGNKSFTYDWAQPIAAPLSIMANIVQKNNSDATLKENIFSSLDTAGNILLEQSFLTSIKNVLTDTKGAFTGLEEEILGLPARAIPTFMKQIADMTDTTQRTTYEYQKPLQTAINQIKVKIPVLSKTLAPSVDTLGNNIQKYGGNTNLFNVFINPANINSSNQSLAGNEIYKVYKATGDATIMPKVSPYYIKNNNEEVILTSKQKSDFQKVSGTIIEKNVENLLMSDEYTNMSDTEKADTINNIVNYSYAIAKNKVLNIDISKSYKKANEYSKIGSISDYYTFKSSIDDTSSDTKRESIKEYLINNNTLNDKQLSYLYGSYYSSNKNLTTILDSNIPMKEYIKYDSEEFDSDYNNKGIISNSRKKKVFSYVNSLNLTAVQKAILIKMNYSSFKKYDNKIINYINNQKLSIYSKATTLKKIGIDKYDNYLINEINNENLSINEKSKKLKELGFTIRNGRVYK